MAFRLPIHRGKIVKAFWQAQTPARLEREPLPGYAPDLHPLDGGVWHWLKNVALANVRAADLAELKHEPRAALARRCRKPNVIKASFVEAKLASSMSRSVMLDFNVGVSRARVYEIKKVTLTTSLRDESRARGCVSAQSWAYAGCKLKSIYAG